jgi:menaquinone-dependent protoporphyrinogen oxidase
MTADNVLVAYGTKNGSTAGIADIIGETLRTEGLSADVVAARQVRDVSGYDAVIVGGALYMGRWHADARRFARRHAADLKNRPVWLFSSGPLDDSADTGEIPPVGHVTRTVASLGARGHVTFGGRLDENARGFIARAMLRNGRGGDFRNPERIAAWTRQIAAELRGRVATGG